MTTFSVSQILTKWAIVQDVTNKVWSDPSDPGENPAWEPSPTPNWSPHDFGSAVAAAKIVYLLNHAQDT
jgi:hypothetical protein